MFYVVCYIVCQKENPVLKWEFWANSHFPEGRAGTQTLFPGPWLMLNEGTGDSRSAAPKRLAGVSEEAARGRCFLTFAPGCSDPGDNHSSPVNSAPRVAQLLSGISGETPEGPDLWTNTPGNPKMNFCQSFQK